MTFVGFYSILYVGGLIFLAVKTEESCSASCLSSGPDPACPHSRTDWQ